MLCVVYIESCPLPSASLFGLPKPSQLLYCMLHCTLKLYICVMHCWGNLIILTYSLISTLFFSRYTYPTYLLAFLLFWCFWCSHYFSSMELNYFTRYVQSSNGIEIFVPGRMYYPHCPWSQWPSHFDRNNRAI